MQIQHLLAEAADALAAAGIEDSRLEAELLLRGCLNLSRSELFLRLASPLPPDRETHFQKLLSRRCLREPLQYILGSCEFWSLDFLVTPAVLIPRPETEFLLTHALSILQKEAKISPRHILDLCTGSGVIAVVLAKEFSGAQVTAADFSLEALAVARENISRHELTQQIRLICADLLTCFRPAPLFDLLVSNPPYIKSGDLPVLAPEVRDWEPHLALSGGSSGLDTIRRICRSAGQLLRPGGWLFMEIGADIGRETEQVFLQAGEYEQVKVVPDWAGRPRVLQAEKLG
ncbi:MAG: peptide chain release factor N(5)-glutamine methyltransferase [Candidatus Electrothrix sp. YB6]